MIAGGVFLLFLLVFALVTLTNFMSKNANAWQAHNRLALCSVSDTALEHYISQHPEVKELNFCLDNDKSGVSATQKFMSKYRDKGYIVNNIPPKNKDYNEELKSYVMSKNPKVTKPCKPMTL
ncbi:MAG: toprim domain-containing protein [Bacillota bacterium]|nr:toprim domain-containing protein [Bacillota bacterium]